MTQVTGSINTTLTMGNGDPSSRYTYVCRNNNENYRTERHIKYGD